MTRRRSVIIGSVSGVILAALLYGGMSGVLSEAAGLGPAPVVGFRPHDRAASDAGALQDPAGDIRSPLRSAATASRIQIAAIGVDSALEQLALDPTLGVLTPPVDWQSAGWYRDGTVPGDIGPAVIAGHVDSISKPAVFARLVELVPGSVIVVTRSDGTAREFAVDRLARAPKDAFPTAEVYGPTPTAQLRLITCDGVFNRSTGHYLDNLIVYASLVR